MERELWQTLSWLVRRLGERWGSWRYSSADVLEVHFWSVVHDRPMVWATVAEHWPPDLRPAWLVPQSTLSRRMRRPETVELMLAVEQHLLSLLAVSSNWVRMIDGKPLAVSAVSKDPDVGVGRCAGSWVKGYKLHAVWGCGPMPIAWALTPMNVSEKTIAQNLIANLPGSGYLLGDTSYDVNGLYDLAAQEEYQLVAKKTPHRGRGGLGHRRQSPSRVRSMALLKTRFGQALFRERPAIERNFGTIGSFGGGLAPLPAWVRRFTRVRNWVHAKLLTSGARYLVKHHREKLAFA